MNTSFIIDDALRGRPKMTSLKGGSVDFFLKKDDGGGGGLAAKPPKEIPQGEGGISLQSQTLNS